MTSVHRNALIIVGLVLKAFKSRHDILVGDRGELRSVNSLNFDRRPRNVLLAYFEHLVANVFTFPIAIEPKDDEVTVC